MSSTVYESSLDLSVLEQFTMYVSEIHWALIKIDPVDGHKYVEATVEIPLNELFYLNKWTTKTENLNTYTSIASLILEIFKKMEKLLDTLPVCQDFNRQGCTRPTCRFVHIREGCGLQVVGCRVVVCRDAAAGTCRRAACRYYHIPVQLPPALRPP